MTRWFNTSGANLPEHHYTLPVLRRLPAVKRLVDRMKCFVLHAPRQVGKTTSLLALARELTADGRYVAALLSMEVGAPFRDNVDAAETAVLEAWREAARHQLPEALQPPPWPAAATGSRIIKALGAWSRAAGRPLVVFLDEIDALHDDALLSILRQLRDGYRNRPESFPWSLALIGLRDVRDYEIVHQESRRLGTASPFNIKSDSLTMRNFTHEEVAELYGQHTAETGQRFEQEAIGRAFWLTQGQPWLVNALAAQITDVLVEDRQTPIASEHVDQARDLLIKRQDTHLDSLGKRLTEERIRAIIEPMMAGQELGNVPTDDIRFACDLGLLTMTADGGLDVANPIYRQIIADRLMFSRRASLPQLTPSWLTPEGHLDEDALLQAVLSFWRQHGEPLMRGAPYSEIAPHLVLMAYFDRVTNGGGRVEREYAIGRGRMDLCIHYGDQRLAVEIKVHRDGQRDPAQRGMEQLDGYLAGLQLDHGWLFVFDKRAGLAPLEERLTTETLETPAGRKVVVIRA